MDILQNLNSVTTIAIVAAAVIIGLVLFAKFIKGLLKLAIIAVMVACILYLLREAGLF